VLILTKPVVASQIAQVLRLTLDPLGRHRERHVTSTAP
jgi:hypothetical protein